MAKLRITRATGEVTDHPITPAIEMAFELHFKAGIHKTFREQEKQSDIYWLAWECLRRADVTVPTFGLAFVETLTKVEVLDDEANF
jgi:hypothetical protein